MLDEWKRKISENSEPGLWGSWGKKSRYLIVVVVCLGLLALIWPQGNSSSSNTDVPASLPHEGVALVKATLAGELEGILSEIEGVGKVQVSITLSSDGLKSYARNTKDDRRETVEMDKTGADRNIKEENQSSDIALSGGAALLVEEGAPEVVGVLVVAEGAQDSKIKEQLTDATTTLLNISPYQVRVVARKGDMQ